MDIRGIIGRNVRRIRLAMKPRLSQEDLAFDAGMDRTYISAIERGKANPSVLKLARIAKRLNVRVHDLMAPVASDESVPKNLPRGRNVHHQGRKLGAKRRKRKA